VAERPWSEDDLLRREPRNREEGRHPESPPDDLLKVPEAARRLGVNPETLYRLIKAGNFPPAVRIGTSIRVSVPRLEQFLHGDAR
jgi:excisionase family DNA binding protein